MDDQITTLTKALEANTTAITDLRNESSVMNEQIAKVLVNVASIFARIDMLDKVIASNNTAPKRVCKTIPDKTSGDSVPVIIDTPVSSPAKPTHSNDNDKILNSLTFFKKIVMYNNYNGLRDHYTESIELVKKSSPTKNIENSEKYWISIGSNIWKTLDKTQKKEISDEYKKWKDSNNTTVHSQLNDDEEED